MRRVLPGLFLLMALPALASPRPIPSAGLTADIPQGWKLSQDRSGGVLTSPDEAVMLMFAAVSAGATGEAVSHAGAVLKKTVKGLQMGDPEGVTVNGLEGIAVDGAGRMDGSPVEVGMLLLRLPVKNRVALVMGLAKKGNRHQAAVAAVMQSLKAMPATKP
jgi:predicted Zn-dependent protease